VNLMKNPKTAAGRRGKKLARTHAFPFEFRLKVVRLHLEEGYSRPLPAEQFSISTHSIQRWVRAYRSHGEEGLHSKPRSGGSGRRLAPAEVCQQMVDIKARHPRYGPRRIADLLRRFFLLPASASTVHRELSSRGLTDMGRRKPGKISSKPRSFERARPNQMWQSDIMTFQLTGRNAYLTGFIGDYSRYITALGLYRSQSAAAA
jgi:transposase